MQTKYENSKRINNEILKLKKYTQNGEYQRIDEWFKKNKISQNFELENFLLKKITDNLDFFFLSLTDFSDIKSLNKERIKKEIAILKNLSFKNQLKFIFSLKEVNSDHFNALKLTPENKQNFKSDKYIISIITEKFATKDTENFTEIDEIQKILGFNVMEQKIDTAIFCFDIRYINYKQYGSYYLVQNLHLPISQSIFSPKYDIIFNYSEEKRKFLEERNIVLPTIEEANVIYYEILKTIGDENFNTFISKKSLEEKLEQSFKNYQSIKLNLDLENELQTKNIKRKVKI